jgi:hypothetical protein
MSSDQSSPWTSDAADLQLICAEAIVFQRIEQSASVFVGRLHAIYSL